MGAFLYLPGTLANQAAHGRTVITPTPAEDALFPKAHLVDGRADRLFKFGSTASQYDILMTLDRILNGNLDAWTSGSPDSWTKTIKAGDPTIVETTVAGEVVTGSAAKFSSDTTDDEAELTQDFNAVAGESLRVTGSMRGDGTQDARAQIINLTLGKYLKSDGTWTTTATDLFTETGSSHAAKSLNFSVESYPIAQIRDMVIRLRLYAKGIAAAAHTAFWDDWFIFPAVDLFAILGHNITPGWTVQIRADASAVLIDTMTVKKRAFFKKLASVERRRNLTFRLIPNTALTNFAPQLTEAVIGNATTLTRKPGFSQQMERSERWPRIAPRGVTGELGSFLLADEAHIDPFVIEFFGPRSELDELLEKIWAFTRGGHEPIVFVPEDSLADVFMGKLSELLSVRRRLDSVDLWVYSVEFEHLPYQTTL